MAAKADPLRSRLGRNARTCPPDSARIARHRRLCWLVALLTGAAPLATAEAGPQRSFFQSQQIAWLTSATWLSPAAPVAASTTPMLIVPDLLRARFLTVSPGASLETLAQGASGINHPATIRPEPQNGYLLVEDYADSSIHKLDASLRPVEVVDFRTALQARGKEYKAFWNWFPFGQDLVFFGDFLEPGADRRNLDNWSTAFAVRTHDNRIVKVQEQYYPGPSRHFYLENRDYLAATSGAAFILQWQSATASLLKVVRDPRSGSGYRVSGQFELPADFRSVPYLDDLNGWQSDAMFATTTEYYRRIEGARAAMGVVSWKDRLFLVAKEPIAADGTTVWWLVELSTEQGRELRRWKLPVSAAHLTVVPGESWAFFEKQAVVTYGPQRAPQIDIPSLTTVPASELLAGGR